MNKPNLPVFVLSGIIILIAGLRFGMAPFPNIEPIMLFTIVSALTLGPISGFLVGFGSMALSDLFVGMGPWTVYTSLTYGLVGILTGFLGIIRKRWGRLELTVLVFVMTILWDLITATFWAIQTMQPLTVVYALQVPFTLLHLSNCIFAFLFAPYLMKALSRASEFSITKFLKRVFAHT